MKHMSMKEMNYKNQAEFPCCASCKYNDRINDEGFNLCRISDEEVSVLGICDIWEGE